MINHLKIEWFIVIDLLQMFDGNQKTKLCHTQISQLGGQTVALKGKLQIYKISFTILMFSIKGRVKKVIFITFVGGTRPLLA